MAASGGDPTVSIKLKVGTSAQQLAGDMAKTMQEGASSAAAAASTSGEGMSKAFIPAKGIFGAIGNEFHKLQTSFGGTKLTAGLDKLPKVKDDAKEAGDEFSRFAAAVDRSAMSSKSAGISLSSLGGLAKGAGSVGIFAVSGLAIAAAAGLAAIAGGAYAANARMESLKGTTLEMIALSPNKNIALKDAHDVADAYDMSFRRIALGSGQTRDAVEAAFKSVAAGLDPFRQGGGIFGGTMTTSRKSGAQVEAVVKDMSQASRIVPGGLDTLTKEYDELKSGKFASTGAIVAMATATKTLKGNAAEVSLQMARMTDARRIQIAEEAIHRMAKQAKDMPMSFAEVSNSFHELVGLASASFGEPFVAQLMPLLTDVRTWFVTNASQIEITARQVGQYVAGFVNGVVKVVSAFYNVFSDKSSAFGTFIRDAFDYAKQAFQWIVDNAATIAKTFDDVFGAIVTTLGNALKGWQLLIGDVKSALGVKPKDMTKDDAQAYISTVMGGLKKGAYKVEDTELAKANIRSTAADKAFTPDERAKIEEQLQDIVGPIEDFQASMTAISRDPDATAAGATLVKMYNDAITAHNEGQIAAVDNLLRGNETLQSAFIKLGSDVEGGLVKLATDLGDTNFLDKIRSAQKASLDHGKALAPVMQFNGNTFNIKQDFRDQDPDRVMLVFKQDIVQSAQNRVQPRATMGPSPAY